MEDDWDEVINSFITRPREASANKQQTKPSKKYFIFTFIVETSILDGQMRDYLRE
jgi:hypothetical protein